MTKKINWGIIGCGDVTEIKSGPAFNKVDNSSLVAVMRRDAAKAEDYAKRHNVPRWYSNANDLIADAEVNAIYIATPPSSHEAYAIAAMSAGKPVYLEKPMTNTYAAATKIAALAKAKNMKCVVAHYRREQPRFKKIKQLIEEKVIGEILFAQIELFKPPLSAEELADPRHAWRVDPAIAGGGLFHDLAPHQLDLMYYFFGQVKSATGISTNQGKNYVAADFVAGTILFENNIACIGTWCFNTPPSLSADTCEITGTKGRISFNFFSSNNISVTINDTSKTISFDELQHVQQPMIDATVKYFLDEAVNPCSAEEGAEVMRLLEAFTKN